MSGITVTRVDEFTYLGDTLEALGDGLYAAKDIVIRCDGCVEYYYCDYTPAERKGLMSVYYAGQYYNWFEAYCDGAFMCTSGFTQHTDIVGYSQRCHSTGKVIRKDGNNYMIWFSSAVIYITIIEQPRGVDTR